MATTPGESGRPLKVVSLNTGAGKYTLPGGGVVVATIYADEDDHPSGVTITRSTQNLYQTEVIKKLVVNGYGFTDATDLTFSPALVKNVDYTQKFMDKTKLILTLRKNKKWRYDGGALVVTKVNNHDKTGVVPVGSGNLGIQVAYILQDPQVEESERIVFASHTNRLVIRGSGFALEGTELTLTPTKRSAYEIESLEMTEIVLKLNEGHAWAAVEEKSGTHEYVYVTKIDTGAGEVMLPDDGVIVAKVEPDVDDNHCDDSCEWALDGVCDDGSSKGREWFDDDYGGYYGYEDDYYGYDYYYYGDDDFLAPVCDSGTDCTDCGGPPTSDMAVTCDNSCDWAQDGFCDDTRTSGLCALGTDCFDCGPVGSSNFSSWDDDGWWDDDDNYWEVDDTFEYATYGGGDGDGLHDAGTGGGLFVAVLEGMVYLVGALICGAGVYVAVQYYQSRMSGGGPHSLYKLAPTMDPDMESSGHRKKKDEVFPITPDVTYTN